jgi:hypothetical protein
MVIDIAPEEQSFAVFGICSRWHVGTATRNSSGARCVFTGRRKRTAAIPRGERQAMQNNKAHLTHANSLRADILAAPAVWLPRRDVLLQWLNGFVERAQAASYELGETEAADLTALEHFLRKRNVPLTGSHAG